MVKCKCCGKEINYVNVDLFDIHGSDSFERVPLYECDDNAVYIEPGQIWTGNELSEEEQIDTIRCPYCDKFPFNEKDIQVEDIVRVVMFKDDEETHAKEKAGVPSDIVLETYKQAINDLLKEIKDYGIISTECSFSHLMNYEDKNISEDELWQNIQLDTNVTINRLAKDLIKKMEKEHELN